MGFCCFISPITRIYGGLYYVYVYIYYTCMGLPENMQPGPTILMINYNFLYQMQFGYYGIMPHFQTCPYQHNHG